ncbi:MAG: hypothetical protein PF590_07135 [Candidatus Delongbacteria bacterium]|jgi:hypothetical protein|nr:hypothetical protein [Candidatus Delongbacteria bacterium]
MKRILFSGIVILLPVLLFAQNDKKDSTFSVSDYYIKAVKEKPYDESKLDTVKNTRVALIPPEHFVFAKDIPGYIHPGTSSSIQVKDIEGTSWPVIDKVMTKEHLEGQGVKLVSREEVELHSGLSGVIYTVSFETKGVEFERMMMFAGDYNYTIWLNANYPVSLKKIIIKPLLSSLLSANIVLK